VRNRPLVEPPHHPPMPQDVPELHGAERTGPVAR
jgi:hypothetical protein